MAYHYACGHDGLVIGTYCRNAVVDNNTGETTSCQQPTYSRDVHPVNTKCLHAWCTWTASAQVWQCHVCGHANVDSYCNNYVRAPGDRDREMCLHMRCEHCKFAGDE